MGILLPCIFLPELFMKFKKTKKFKNIKNKKMVCRA